MIPTGENRITGRTPCPSATLSTTQITWTDLKSNSSVPSDGPQTNRLSRGTAQFKAEFNLEKALIFICYLACSLASGLSLCLLPIGWRHFRTVC